MADVVIAPSVLTADLADLATSCQEAVEPSLRTGVGIDRKLRAASPEVLFDRQVVDAPGLTLRASFEANLTPEDLSLLKESAVLVTSVGGAQSRGLGEVQLRWEDASGASRPTAVLPDTPVLANTGVKHDTVAEVLKVADGCIVGSSLKVDGDTWNPVDSERAGEFMRLAHAARGSQRT